METLTRPVRRFATRKTTSPFLLMASSSLGTAGLLGVVVAVVVGKKSISMTRYPRRKVELYAAVQRTYGGFAWN